MESLLRWSIEHSNDGTQPTDPSRIQNLDPGIIDAILGKADSELMKEALTIAVDEKKSDDERIQALDDLEMLVEQIDNANNVEKMKMWEPLQALLHSSNSSEAIKTQTLWVIGTAIQNNPSAQSAYLALLPMPILLKFLNPSVKSPQLRSKAVYALSGLLKHNAPAVKQLEEAGGWQVLKAALEDSDISVRRKTAFLLNSLIIPSTHVPQPTPPPPTAPTPSPGSNSTSVTIHPSDARPETVHPNSHASMQADPASTSTSPAALKALEEYGILQSLISAVTTPVPYGPDGEGEGDADFDEKVIRSLHTYATSCDGKFSETQKSDLRAHVKSETAKAGGEPGLAEKWGLTPDELAALKHAMA